MEEQTIAIASEARFDFTGNWFAPGVNQPFSLQEPGQAWFVNSGTLDLYLTGAGENAEETKGPRFFIKRIAAGHGVFGFPANDSGQILVAVASPGTELCKLSWTELQEASSGPAARAARSLVENWVEQISAVASPQTPPKVFYQIQAGTDVDVGFKAQVLMPKEGVLWVQQSTGDSYPLDQPELRLRDGEWFPVSRHGWLKSAPSTRLKILGWGFLQLDDPTWSGLEAFQGAIFFCLVRNRTLADEKELNRLKAKAEADAFRVDAALSCLGVPLDSGMREAPTSVDALDDPLLMAAQAVGHAQGLIMKPYEGQRAGLKPKDPVAAIAKASSLRTRRVLLKDDWWSEDCGPILAFLDRDNRPVALLPRSAGRYDLYDPADRSTVALNAAVAASLNGFAYVFYRHFPEIKLTASELLKFGLFGCSGDLYAIGWMGLGTGFLAMAPPIISSFLFDTVIPGAQRGQLMQLAFILVSCAVTSALFSITQSFALLRLEGKLDAAIQAAVWDRLLSLPVPFFRNYTAGDLAVRGMGINQMRQVLTGSTLTSILSGVFAIFSFALLFYYSWYLALVASGLVVLAFLVSLICGYLQIGLQRDMSALKGRISGSVLQFIAGIAKLRISGFENRAFAIWAAEFAKQKLISIRAQKVQNYMSVFASVYPVVCMGFIFYFTAKLMADPKSTPLSTGDFIAFNAAFTQFLTAALRLSSAVISVLAIIPLYERAQPIFGSLPEVTLAKSLPGELTGKIEINHVVFRYREGTPIVLRDLSLSIAAGEFVAFVGPSGSGKSTLFRILLGFEKPESGSVYYDGQDLETLDVQAVRRQIGVVLQNSRLFTGDIFTNIVGSAPLTIDDAWEAARLASLDQDLKNMPMGMHTVVSEGGGGLSGGQRQRLMIARAIVNKPRILFFDEATSALDNETQATVGVSLHGLQATRVVIAHRLSTILHADRIFVVDKGQIVESGTYQDLIERAGLFTELAKRQLT